MTWQRLALAALATHRLTRLLTADEITKPLRKLYTDDEGEPTSRLGYLLTCDWCLSMWLAVPVAAVAIAAPRRLTDVALVALAASDATGLITVNLAG